MSRELHFYNISEQLALLQIRARNESSLNLQNVNVFAEDFYCALLNLVYGWNLKNINSTDQNAEGIDLIDENQKIIFQVSVSNTAKKLKHSFKELENKPQYQGYRFKFLSVGRKADNLRHNKDISAPDGITYVPSEDIYDVESMLHTIKGMDVQKLSEISNLVDAELGELTQAKVYPSALNYIVTKLSELKLSDEQPVFDIEEYDIDEKIKINDIGYWEEFVQDYKIYDKQLKRIYDEYDQLGKNKSLAIEDTLKTIYRQNKKSAQGEKLFDLILEKTFYKLTPIDNEEMTEDEIRFCLKIILVSAFMDCMIFEKPTSLC